MLGHLLQVILGQEGQEIVHRRVVPPTVAERDQLVEEIAGGLAGEPREIGILRSFALRAVARGAGENPLRHRVRRLLGRLRTGGLGERHEEKGRRTDAASPGHAVM